MNSLINLFIDVLKQYPNIYNDVRFKIHSKEFKENALFLMNSASLNAIVYCLEICEKYGDYERFTIYLKKYTTYRGFVRAINGNSSKGMKMWFDKEAERLYQEMKMLEEEE